MRRNRDDRAEIAGNSGEQEPGGPQSQPGSSKKLFQELGLESRSADAAEKAGFSVPTEVQERVIPEVLAGKDVIASSETGSGKTASFVLPMLDLIDYEAKSVQAAVLVPTRELCRQVAGEFRRLGGSELRVVEIYGGVSYSGQRKNLAKKPHVMVGTPGRVLDLLNSDLKLGRVKTLVLDEADRMTDMGFAPQIRSILEFIPRKRQTLSFSATIPPEVSRLATMCMDDPVHIQVGQRAKPPKQLVQQALDVMPREKDEALLSLLEEEEGTALVFTRTKARADQVDRMLRRAGHSSCSIHSDLSQKDRQRALENFKSGKRRIMVATDVASRGLDIEAISLVVNYDLPENPEDYVHRVGRTGRADAPGKAVSLVTYKEYSTIRLIEKLTGHTFENMKPARNGLDRRAAVKRKIR